jgi:regulator of protease activity HflC (stomatin/prohibitin superfamily)
VEAAFSWLGKLAEWFGRFFPRLVIVRANEGGVRWKYGKKVLKLEPGLIIYWPLFTVVEVTSTARQTLLTGTQSLTTADGRTVSLSLLLVYRVTNPVAALNNTFEYEDTLDDVSKTAAVDVVSSHAYDWVHEQITGEVEDTIFRTARNEMRKYGVSVESASIVDFTSARAYRLLGDS